MKISCLQENLSRGLAVVGRAVASRATLPVTQNVLLSIDQSMLKLSATNLEIAMTTWVGAMIEDEGSITVPARLLTEFVNSLPNDRIDLELDPGSGLLKITSGRSEAHINGTDASEFPPIPTVDDGVAAQIDPVVLKAAIGRVAFAAATEESRPVLTGVEVKLSDGQGCAIMGQYSGAAAGSLAAWRRSWRPCRSWRWASSMVRPALLPPAPADGTWMNCSNTGELLAGCGGNLLQGHYSKRGLTVRHGHSLDMLGRLPITAWINLNEVKYRTDFGLNPKDGCFSG